jgi:hypothetical protein
MTESTAQKPHRYTWLMWLIGLIVTIGLAITGYVVKGQSQPPVIGHDVQSSGGGVGESIVNSGPGVGGDVGVTVPAGTSAIGTRVIQNGPGTGLVVIQNGPGVGFRSSVTVGPKQ